MKIFGNTPSADSAGSRDSLSSQNATWGLVLFFCCCFFLSPHFIDDTLKTKAECVKDSLICRKYMFLAKAFALRSMGIQSVLSPTGKDLLSFSIVDIGCLWKSCCFMNENWFSWNIVNHNIFILTVPMRYFCCGSLMFLLSVFILWFIYYVSDIFCKF